MKTRYSMMYIITSISKFFTFLLYILYIKRDDYHNNNDNNHKISVNLSIDRGIK